MRKKNCMGKHNTTITKHGRKMRKGCLKLKGMVVY